MIYANTLARLNQDVMERQELELLLMHLHIMLLLIVKKLFWFVIFKVRLNVTKYGSTLMPAYLTPGFQILDEFVMFDPQIRT
jgi:hypothetical protein